MGSAGAQARGVPFLRVTVLVEIRQRLAGLFLLKQKTGYEILRSDWSSDVCSSDLVDVLFKDIGYALSLARQNNVPTPMTAVVDEVFKAARASGRGPQAQQVIIQLWEDLLGLE